MDSLTSLVIRGIFTENLALAFLLGMCTFLAMSKRIETAIGVGVAVIVSIRRRPRHIDKDFAVQIAEILHDRFHGGPRQRQ